MSKRKRRKWGRKGIKKGLNMTRSALIKLKTMSVRDLKTREAEKDEKEEGKRGKEERGRGQIICISSAHTTLRHASLRSKIV